MYKGLENTQDSGVNMSSQAGFLTKNGNLSAKARKRIFKDGGAVKRAPKKAKVGRTEPDEVIEAPLTEIPDLGFCVLQVLVHACSTPRSTDIQNIISRYLEI